MSAADTAEYQLERLAETLTLLNRAMSATSASAAYKEAYRTALADIGRAMGLATSTHWHCD
jgi:hypothetical protein